MILGFSTQIKEKPTYFIEKIWKGIKENISRELYFKILSHTAPEEMIKQYPIDAEVYEKIFPKVHTIREDSGNRWKIGCKIDFFINVRKKNMFRFAPVLPVVNTQKIEIRWIGFSDSYRPWVKIDGKLFYDVAEINKKEMLLLAQNDGFESIEDFFSYFNKDFSGKLIHWTDLKY